MKFEIYIERKVSTFPYENVTVGLSQEFEDSVTPREAAFIEVRDTLEGWITEEAKRCGAKSPERVILQAGRKPRETYLDLSNEPQDRRRFR